VEASIPWPYNESNARDWIATHAHKWAHGESAQFAVVLAGGDRFWDHSDSTSLIGVKERRWVNTGSLVRAGARICHSCSLPRNRPGFEELFLRRSTHDGDRQLRVGARGAEADLS